MRNVMVIVGDQAARFGNVPPEESDPFESENRELIRMGSYELECIVPSLRHVAEFAKSSEFSSVPRLHHPVQTVSSLVVSRPQFLSYVGAEQDQTSESAVIANHPGSHTQGEAQSCNCKHGDGCAIARSQLISQPRQRDRHKRSYGWVGQNDQ